MNLLPLAIFPILRETELRNFSLYRAQSVREDTIIEKNSGPHNPVSQHIFPIPGRSGSTSHEPPLQSLSPPRRESHPP